MTRTEYWTAAGVIVAALIGGLSAGYYYGQDVAGGEIEDLEREIDNLKKVNSIDTPVLLDTLNRRSVEIGEKIRLSEQINSLKNKISALETTISNKTEENDKLTRDKLEIKRQLTQLTSLIRKDFSEISEIFVPRNETKWIIPGTVAINVSHVFDSSAYTTITDIIKDQDIRLGERIDIEYEQKQCFVILIKLHQSPDIATFSFACQNKQEKANNN